MTSSCTSDGHQVRNETRFWNWTRSVMVPELKIGEDYAGKKPRRKEKKLITDRVHLLLGNGIMRQVRIREKSEYAHSEVHHRARHGYALPSSPGLWFVSGSTDDSFVFRPNTNYDCVFFIL